MSISSNSSTSIVDWLISLSISNLLTTDDILTGHTLHVILKKTIPQYKNQFVTPSSAVNKITNWNNLIKQLQKISIKVTSDQKNQILHGNQTIVYNILTEVKAHVEKNRKQTQVDINKIDHRADPKNSKSLLELFILVLIKNLGLNAKQSVALLSNDSKYLAHILAKGFKQQPKPVMNLLKDFQSLLPQILEFCINKQNQIFFLKSLKPGLISKFQQISLFSLQILQQFTLSIQPPSNPFQIFKLHLIPTIVLQFRRHPSLSNDIAHMIIELTKFNKQLIAVLCQNMSNKEVLAMGYEIMLIAEDRNMLNNKGFYGCGKIEEVVNMAIQGLGDSNVFSIAILVLLKVLETNYQLLMPSSNTSPQQQKSLVTMLNNLQHLAIHKKSHVTLYICSLFTLLSLFGHQKNPIAPLIFKLIIQKYKLTINFEQSEWFGQNFLYLLDEFPSIPSTMIVDAIGEKYQNYHKQVITDKDVEVLGRIVFGNADNDSHEYLNQKNKSKVSSIDQKTSLKIYNFLSKLFFEEISNAQYIADIIIHIVKSQENSKMIFDLNLKMVKVCLAVHYANIRKLNMSKSIVQGIVKLDQSNVLIKRKNLDIEYLLEGLINIQNIQFKKNIQPLICYSFIQSESKNKPQTRGLQRILSLFGNVQALIKKYQQDVKILHEQKRNPKKKTIRQSIQKQQTSNNYNNYASGDIINRKKLNPGQNYSLYLSKISKITDDAQKGLQKYQKLHVQKLNKQQLEQFKKQEQEEKKLLLQKKFTNKVLEKGIRIDPKIDNLNQYLYPFDQKENELLKQKFYDLSSLHIFNPDEEQPNDIEALKYVMKKYNKVLRLYYQIYGGKLRPNAVNLFDQLAQKNHLMQVASVWKLFKDHFLDQFMTVREAQYLVQKINAQKKKSYTDISLLDFETFEAFIIQASLTMFSRPPKDLSGYSIAYLVEETFYRFRLYASENKIDSRLFEDQAETLNSQNADEVTLSLNQKLKENSDYILPQGYKKITEKKVQFYHKISLSAFDEAYSDVLDVLDQILYEKVGFHIIQPYSEVVTNVYAKSLLLKKRQQKGQDFMQKYFSLNIKKQLSNFSNQDRLIARQVAFCISQIVDNVELGKKYYGSKNMKYTLKQQQQQRRKYQQQQSRKRQKRDRQIKKQLEKHKAQQENKKKYQQQEKAKQQHLKQQQKKKRQKYEQQLKKKVQEYQKKKEQQKKLEQLQKQKQKNKEKQAFQRKRQQLAKANKIIMQKKQQQKLAKQTEANKKAKQQALRKQQSKKSLAKNNSVHKGSPKIHKKVEKGQKIQKQNKNGV